MFSANIYELKKFSLKIDCDEIIQLPIAHSSTDGELAKYSDLGFTMLLLLASYFIYDKMPRFEHSAPKIYADVDVAR